MANVTGASAQQLRTSATNIGNLLTDDVMAIFRDLNTAGLTAGNFPAAAWLLSLVNDRVAGIQTQAEILKTVFQRISVSLNTIATDLESTDTDAATKLLNDVKTLETDINTDLASVTAGNGGNSGKPY